MSNDVIVIETPVNAVVVQPAMNQLVISGPKLIGVTPDIKRIEIVPEERILSVSAPGPPGPQGPIGPPGGAVVLYDRVGVPAIEWIVTHNMGRLVHVTVILDDGSEVFPDIDQHDPNILTISFAVPRSGKALVG